MKPLTVQQMVAEELAPDVELEPLDDDNHSEIYDETPLTGLVYRTETNHGS